MNGKPIRGGSTLVLLGVLAAVGIGALVSNAEATAPGKNGGIAFKRYLDSGRSTGAIFTVDASGKAERQVTRPEAGVVDDQPDWSPDGSLLVFERGVPDSPFAIYTRQARWVGPDAAQPAVRLRARSQCEDGAWAPASCPTGSASSTREPRGTYGTSQAGTRSSTPTSS